MPSRVTLTKHDVEHFCPELRCAHSFSQAPNSGSGRTAVAGRASPATGNGNTHQGKRGLRVEVLRSEEPEEVHVVRPGV